MQNDGYSLDDKRNKIQGSDLPDIVESFGKRNKCQDDDRKAKHFFVPKQEIEENEWDLSISKYKEEEYTEANYEAPEVILNKLDRLENEINKGLLELRGLMK
jgi:type I restriction enzyme M protein